MDAPVSRVSGATNTGALAAYIAKELKDKDPGAYLHLLTIGAGATYKACKALAAVHGRYGVEVWALFAMTPIDMDDGSKSTGLYVTVVRS